jgi:hypothetical protein
MLTQLYSMSKTPFQHWNGNRLGFLTASKMQFETTFVENCNLSLLLTYDINGETQHLFMPKVADSTLPDGSIQTNAIVVGNAVDNLDHLFPVKTSWRILKHTLVVMVKGKVHGYIKDKRN